jgi:Rod binding domain-containing protein
MNAVAQVSPVNSSAADAAHSAKMVRAARQFEAVLLNSLLGSLQHSFSSLGGKKTDSESTNYDYVGMQALSAALAAKGGIGIADRIVASMRQHENRSSLPQPNGKASPDVYL